MENKIMKQYFLGLLIVVLTFNYLKADLFEKTLRIVGASEKNTQQAKIKAVEDGRKDSLIFVISKITSKSSQSKIKRLLLDTSPITFEKRYSLNKENITNKKYEADAYFVFDEKKIKGFLEDNNIPYVNVPLGRYMIIPSYYENGVLIENNLWNNYWEKKNRDSLLSTLIYYDNLNKFKDKSTYLEIQKNLGLDNILLLNLYFEKNGTFTLEIKSAISGKTNKVSKIPSIQQATMIAPAEIEEDKKEEILNSYSANSSEKELKVLSVNYEDWVFIEQKLKDANSIDSFTLESISNDYVQITVKLKTNMEKFKKTMEDNCILFDIPSLILSKIANCND